MSREEMAVKKNKKLNKYTTRLVSQRRKILISNWKRQLRGPQEAKGLWRQEQCQQSFKNVNEISSTNLSLQASVRQITIILRQSMCCPFPTQRW